MSFRVAVTGIGIVANVGQGSSDFWNGLLTGVPSHGFEIQDFDPLPYFDGNAKEARRCDRFAQLAFAAADEAITQAGDFVSDPTRCGSWVGTGVGGLDTLEKQVQVLSEKGPRRVSPFLIPMLMANAASAGISMKYGLQGPSETTVTACAAGTHSIARAADLIRNGTCDVMLTGGTEATLTPIGRQGFINMTAVSSTGISRPFDAERDGFMHSEAAGVLVLEEWEHALERGATILGEILGSASTADAHHITAPAPEGAGAVRCMLTAIDDAGVTPEDIVHINAHGTSTPLNDAAEAEAIVKVFGSETPIVTSTKGATGHTLGAAGAIEAIAVLLAIQNKQIPQTHGTSAVDPELAQIDLVVDEPRDWNPGPSLSNSFGFGGHNGTLVIGPSS